MISFLIAFTVANFLFVIYEIVMNKLRERIVKQKEIAHEKNVKEEIELKKLLLIDNSLGI